MVTYKNPYIIGSFDTSGIVDSRTWNIHFDPAKFFNELYQGTVPDYAVDSLENNVSCLNRSMDEIEHLEGGTTIGETWLQMKEFLGESPFILIDANQNNLIVRFKFTSNKLMTFCLLQRPSLHFCALHSYSTTDARHFDEEAYFDREVAPKFFAIQDYVEVINSFDGKIEGGEVTTKFIEERFQVRDYILRISDSKILAPWPTYSSGASLPNASEGGDLTRYDRPSSLYTRSCGSPPVSI